MEQILLDILALLRKGQTVDAKVLEKIIRKHNRNIPNNADHYSKKKLMPYYLKVKKSNPDLWHSWKIDPDLEKQLFSVLQIKPRRTASGVATITVITKPWKCTSNCIYCPNDIRMPKSYLSDEPACQRAERNFFDPYLQVSSRLRALTHMGHITDKVELIVLGGTWADYPKEYQIWFVKELFRALNEGDGSEKETRTRRAFYKSLGLSNERDELAQQVAPFQQQVKEGTLTYNQAWETLYNKNDAWQEVAQMQSATLEELFEQHQINEDAHHRMVGLVVETRPDTLSVQSLKLIRSLGATKIQFGVQTLNPEIQVLNKRSTTPEIAQRAFEYARLFGFKIHAHFMVNLLGSNPEADKADFRQFVLDKPYQPDEIKLYPCALVYGTKLCDNYHDGSWNAYSEEDLVSVLVEDTCTTPCFTRVSRMIRDFSAHDIEAGNKKINLRQLVEEKALERSKVTSKPIQEIRFREMSTSSVNKEDLQLSVFPYNTTATKEYFLQWVTPDNTIAGFLRLSLPHKDQIARLIAEAEEQGIDFPIHYEEAMIREVHVYGKVASIGKNSMGAQHLGLGKALVTQAAQIAKEQGYTKLNVISAIGTRNYYRKLGFTDAGLYQQMKL